MLSPNTILIAYVLVMIWLGAFFLRMACGLCQMTLPSWRRSIISVVLVSFLAYLTFDFGAYVLVRSMEDVLIRLPQWYSFGMWFREPIALKWYILAQTGVLKFAPLVPAIIVAGILQVIVFEAQVNFAIGLAVVLLQWTATIVAGYIVSLLFGVVLSSVGWPPQPQTVARSPEAPTSLQVLPAPAEGAVISAEEFLEKAKDKLKEYADSHIEELKEGLGPFTQHLPEPVNNFLERGGWWWVLGALGILALLWLRSLVRRMTRPVKRKKRTARKAPRTGPRLKEDLAWIGAGYTEDAPQYVTVKRMPARLRLVILSLGSRHAGELSEDMADRVLDWIQPGLAAAAAYESPGVRVWPPFYSADGFARAVASNVPIREPKGMKSHWVLVAGQVKMGQTIIHVGMALYTEKPNSLRSIQVQRERWVDVLGIEKSAAPAGTRWS
jgi:hypothetical protein